VELAAENQEVLDLYRQIKLLGADTVFALRNLRLTPLTAEELMHRLMLIDSVIGEIQQSNREE